LALWASDFGPSDLISLLSREVKFWLHHCSWA